MHCLCMAAVASTSLSYLGDPVRLYITLMRSKQELLGLSPSGSTAKTVDGSILPVSYNALHSISTYALSFRFLGLEL